MYLPYPIYLFYLINLSNLIYLSNNNYPSRFISIYFISSYPSIVSISILSINRISRLIYLSFLFLLSVWTNHKPCAQNPYLHYQAFATVRKAEYAVSARIFVNESFKYVIQVKKSRRGHSWHQWIDLWPWGGAPRPPPPPHAHPPPAH